MDLQNCESDVQLYGIYTFLCAKTHKLGMAIKSTSLAGGDNENSRVLCTQTFRTVIRFLSRMSTDGQFSKVASRTGLEHYQDKSCKSI